MTNLEKYLHPSSFYSAVYAQSAMPRAKKGQQKVPIVKRRQGFAPLGVITLVFNLFK